MWWVMLIFSLVGLWFFLTHNFKAEKERKDKIVSLLAGICWLGFGGMFMWITRPWWHWLWFDIIYMNLTFWIFTVLISGALGLLWWIRRISYQKKDRKEALKKEKEKVKKSRKFIFEWKYGYRYRERTSFWYIVIGINLWIALIIILSLLGSPITKVKIYREIASEVRQVTELPETTKVRYLPLEIALRYGENKVQESEIKLGDIDPIIFEDKFSWVAARVPNGLWRSFSYRADGFALIESDGSVKMIRQQMKYGEGMYVTDNIIWKLRERKYWIEIPEIYYLLNGEEIIGIAPYLSYRFEFPVRVPRWGGVFVFHSDGRIEDFTPKQAQQLSYVQRQRIYPEKLARLYVESWTYKNGIRNAWFTHRDQIQIPKINYSSNQMPFLIPTSEGPKWMVAAEPWGRAYGIFKIFFVEANTGKIQLYELSKESALIGPNRVWDYVKPAFPMYDWYRETSKGSTGNILAIEPRPVIKQKKLYWMASLTNLQYGGVSATLLVDAQNPTNILSFKTERDLDEFLSGAKYITPEDMVPTVGKPISPDITQRFQKIKQLQQQLQREIEDLERMLK